MMNLTVYCNPFGFFAQILAVSLLATDACAQRSAVDVTILEIEAKLDQELTEAVELYDREVTSAKKRFLSDMEALQAEVLQSGDIDGAVAIRDEIKLADQRVEDAHPVRRPARSGTTVIGRGEILSGLRGTQWVGSPPGWQPDFQFQSDGFVTLGRGAERSATWTLLGDRHIVSKQLIGESTGVIDFMTMGFGGRTLSVKCVGVGRNQSWFAIASKPNGE